MRSGARGILLGRKYFIMTSRASASKFREIETVTRPQNQVSSSWQEYNFLSFYLFAKSGGCPTYSFIDSIRPTNLRSNHVPSSSANVPRAFCIPFRLQVFLIVVHVVADIERLTPGTTGLWLKRIVFGSIFAKSYSFLFLYQHSLIFLHVIIQTPRTEKHPF